MDTTDFDFDPESALAIVGMAGRFPGATSVDQLWDNLVHGAISITSLTDEHILAAGEDPALLAQPTYVKSAAILDNIDQFDAAFFGYSPGEASVMDPQLRFFLENAWETLEHAGIDPERFPGLIGVYAGSTVSDYLRKNILPNKDVVDTYGILQVYIVNSADDLTSTVAYKLNCKGPSIAIQTFCSTSLVAVHTACQSLLNYECDLALAGGVAIFVPNDVGYSYQEGGIASPDGVVRTFDADAQGSVMGNGVGTVALKRLEDALAEGDTIHAIIRGSAVNNDGIRRAGYTAPGLDGQTRVIAEALAHANVEPDTVSYVEAHGTATPLGDNIELAAMIKAFRRSTEREQFCAIGSVKPNIGHLDRAAGVTGLIKTVMALKHRQLPPHLNFEQASPDIDLASSPFYVNTKLSDWLPLDGVRRAGVSSFGLGGTNAHVVLEEAPTQLSAASRRPAQLVLLSAKTPSALDAMGERLRAMLLAQPDLNLADVAYTLQVGRSAFNHRRAIVCTNTADLVQTLANGAPIRSFTHEQVNRNRAVAFVLGGVGDHYAGLARELYANEPTFRAAADQCCELLQPLLGQDLRTLLWPTTSTASSNGDLHALLGRGTTNPADAALQSTAIAQPAVFVVEYALAQLLASWGVTPSAMLGYSLGEYVAATLAGVLNLPDALRLVATRARLIDALPAGAMLAVALNEADVQPYLGGGVELAAVNGPLASVLAGSPDAIAALAARLEREEVAARMVPTTHAFHTSMLRPIADQLTAVARTLTLNAPTVPYISNVTGTWITPEQATDPTYWAQHLCGTVRFADGIAAILESGAVVFEVGAGQSLSSFVKQHPACERSRWNEIISTLPGTMERGTDAVQSAFTALGRLWLAGVTVDWTGFNAHEQRRRVPLPSYPFERQRYWIEPVKTGPKQDVPDHSRKQLADWFYGFSWKRTTAFNDVRSDVLPPSEQRWLIFGDQQGVGTALAAWLGAHAQHVYMVMPDTGYTNPSANLFTVRPDERADYASMFRALEQRGGIPDQVVHLWTVDSPAADDEQTHINHTLRYGFSSLLLLAQELGEMDIERCRITTVSSMLHDVTGTDLTSPAKSLMVGPCNVIPQENNTLSCRSIDIVIPPDGGSNPRLIQQLVGELLTASDNWFVAFRGAYRWVQTLESLSLTKQAQPARLRQNGVYVITGGLGGIALALADHLYTTVGARLVLVARTALPAPSQWTTLLADPATTETTRHRIEQVSALEARGAEVLVVQADVTDAREMRAAVAQATARFGTINGVFHTAGVPGVGLISLKSPEDIARELAPKVAGTLVVRDVFADQSIDFLILFSSFASIAGGGAGQIAYSAANAFVDAYARKHHTGDAVVMALSWDEWRWDAWNEGLQGYPEEVRAVLVKSRATFGIGFDEGMEALGRIMASNLPQVFITTRDALTTVTMSRQGMVASMLANLQEQRNTQPRHPRPTLATSFVAASTETEHTLSDIWCSLLGIEQIGADDNFFELGGNSLLGIEMMKRVRKAFGRERIPPQVLYDAPSVRTLARYLTQQQVTIDVGALEAQADRRKDKLKQFKQRAQMDTL